MDSTEETIAKDFYKKQIQRFRSETLRLIVENRSKALEYARLGIVNRQPDNLTDGYIEEIADEMQKLAGIILKNRNTKYS